MAGESSRPRSLRGRHVPGSPQMSRYLVIIMLGQEVETKTFGTGLVATAAEKAKSDTQLDRNFVANPGFLKEDQVIPKRVAVVSKPFAFHWVNEVFGIEGNNLE
ncbi:hypothetical protein NDU88_002797 [Pleurodeles waltl]|uniref:Uncharacterized protein n=1 Tax=Pleurodeles waltl TaxID=8319 RepID=A0AAV7NHI8_PLEWA|nr:hypothetical protein NDU88_002797 [Pleurodeles waltl]